MISLRQLKRMLIIDIFGISTLVLPVGLAKTAGIYGGAAIILGTIIEIIIVAVTFRDKDKKLQKKSPVFIIWSLFVLVQLIIGGTVCIKLATKMISVNLLPGENKYIIALLFVIVSWYMIERGIEGKARIGEIVFNYIFIHLIFMFAFSMSDFKLGDVFLKEGHDGNNIILGTYLVLAVFSIILVLLFKADCYQDNRMAKKGLVTALTFCGVLNLIIYEILEGVFSNNVIMNKNWPVISLMTVANVPGRICTRVDAIMAALWIISLLSLLSFFIYASTMVVKGITDKCKRWIIPGALSLAFFAAYVGSEYFEGAYEAIKLFALYVGVPIMLLVFLIRGKDDEKN